MSASQWNAAEEILTTRLTGTVAADEVDAWRLALEREVAKVPDGGQFKLLVDIRGYEPASPDAHKAFRVVIPRFLADYGFRPGFLDLFPEAELPIRKMRGVTCTAHANVHHDAAKMSMYEERLGRANERFFTDIDAATAWIRGI